MGLLLYHLNFPAAFGGDGAGKAAVRIEAGKIAEVVPRLEAFPEGEPAFDCGGRTLTPGLIDLHTHFTGLGEVFSPSHCKDPMKLLASAIGPAGQYLDHGFTTIRDCGSVGRAANYVRDLGEGGLVRAPHILSSGLILSPTEIEQADSIYEMYAFADGPYAFRAAARRELAEHADFIKLMASGAAFHPQGVPKEPIIAPDELREAVETAARKGTYVAAHAHADGAIRACIEAGVRTVEHATYLSDETLSLLERTEGCCLVPTLAAMFVSGPDESGFWHERLGAMLDACCAGLKKAYREGLPIGFGTDCAPFSRQYREGTEFAYRKENCGMADADILRQATEVSARIAGLADRGEIRPGFRADLALWDGDPSAEIMELAKPPAAVWLDGCLTGGYLWNN